MKHTFHINKIEVRSPTNNRLKKYLVRGYAVAGDVPHTYLKQYGADGKVQKSFKSLFTQNFIKKFADKLKYSQVYVDALHNTAKNINIQGLLESMKKKAGKDLEGEINSIESQLELGQLPLAKVSDFRIDDNGIFVETELNPAYREIDETHRKYFDSIWDSLQGGFLNGMSIDFQPTKVVNQNGVDIIDDGEVFGINYVNGAALGSHSGITEVAVRSIMQTRFDNGGNKMENEQEQKQKENTPPAEDISALKAKFEEQQKFIDGLKERQAEEQKAKEQETIEKEKQKYQQEIEQLKSKLTEMQSKPDNTQTQRKGTVAQPPTGDKPREWYAEMAKNMSWKDLITLQAEFGLHKGSVPEQYRQLLNKEPSDVIIQSPKNNI